MLGFIGWLIIGLIAGALGRLLVPGRQPMGLFMTMVLGLIGSFIGGAISYVIFGPAAGEGFHTGGLIMSTLGAVIVLAAYIAYAQRRA